LKGICETRQLDDGFAKFAGLCLNKVCWGFHGRGVAGNGVVEEWGD
jgi:hypothetical protein